LPYAQRLRADDERYLQRVRLLLTFIEKLRQVYSLTKRIARGQLPTEISSGSSPDRTLPPSLGRCTEVVWIVDVAVCESWTLVAGYRWKRHPRQHAHGGSALAGPALAVANGGCGASAGLRQGATLEAGADGLPAIAGIDGTMARRLRCEPIEGRAHPKADTLRDASCTAAYVLHKDGRRWVAVLVLASEDEILHAWGACGPSCHAAVGLRRGAGGRGTPGPPAPDRAPWSIRLLSLTSPHRVFPE
jgi:hypothetical protein